ncbi:MAG: ATP synthase F0 subunit B [Acidobacteriaceae bacterium]|nr:ATP synthase F0 subunit B [Acidobacteriaceae bacterium]
MEILNQLGGLVLGAVPTMILFLLTVVIYGVLVRRPLQRILAERARLTSGAIEQARAAIASAESKTSAYEEKLRAARAAIFAAREARVKQWNAEREDAIQQARQASQQRIAAARKDIEHAAEDARRQIDELSGELSSHVMSAVLPDNVAASEVLQ